MSSVGVVMLQYNPLHCLPSSAELPDSDDTPVDNELQDLMPSLLKLILAQIWRERMDWFFGVDMGIYYEPDQPAIVPDGFLSLGVTRVIDEELRPSYVIWEENNIVPIFALEVVSKTYRGEYSSKKKKYKDLGVLYYAIYSSRRRRRPPLEIYRLIDGEYVLQSGNPLWMPEIGLGLGRERGLHQGVTREWLYWYNQQGLRYLTPDERADRAEQQLEIERQRAEQERQIREDLLRRLRERGIDPDQL